ncbi:hypothetical protein [Rhizomicrobium electricum]|uniref:Uncharacterized protein n=1 Tax=Rhizomicrobium electricum TaxID=480070 RepID=A0ABN1EWR9_9PROT|nr:hypothetical protein [Rhizomicrobium electricum]NIJ49995.1 hypothetical protein [Rhizomicrobium electricum]
MNRFTRLIVAAAIFATPLTAAGVPSGLEVRAPTALEPWDGNAKIFWRKSEYPELYQPTIRLRGFRVPGAAHSDFAVALEERSGRYILIAIERSSVAQMFQREQKGMETAGSRASGRKAPEKTWGRRCTIGLHRNIAEKLIEIWTRMLRDVRPMDSDWVVLDGSTDYFWVALNDKSLAGSTFAPRDDTNPGMQSEILAALPGYCQSGTANLNGIQTVDKARADRNRIEALADHLLARLRDKAIP